MKKSVIAAVLLGWIISLAQVQSATVGFEDLSLAPGTFYNGGPVTNNAGWVSGGVTFGNSYDSTFGGFWNGFSYSNVNDVTTGGFGNQYAAYTGTGFGGSGNYAVGYAGLNTFINLPSGDTAQSIYLTNSTYAALDMLNGSGFSKKFGGSSGNDADYFDVIFTGYTGLGATGTTTGTTTFRLADYTFANNSLDYIVNSWQLLSLTPLGNAASIQLTWESTDVGSFGINTPTYIALDNITIIPEPSTYALFFLAGLSFYLFQGAKLKRK